MWVDFNLNMLERRGKMTKSDILDIKQLLSVQFKFLHKIVFIKVNLEKSFKCSIYGETSFKTWHKKSTLRNPNFTGIFKTFGFFFGCSFSSINQIVLPIA